MQSWAFLRNSNVACVLMKVESSRVYGMLDDEGWFFDLNNKLNKFNLFKKIIFLLNYNLLWL